jgi:hypothetical protein
LVLTSFTSNGQISSTYKKDSKTEIFKIENVSGTTGETVPQVVIKK